MTPRTARVDSAHQTAQAEAPSEAVITELGERKVAPPLTVPPGPTCFECETALHRVTVSGNTSYRRRGLMARLPRRHRSCTSSQALSVGMQRAVLA